MMEKWNVGERIQKSGSLGVQNTNFLRTLRAL